MAAQEERGLELLKRWEHLLNTDVAALVDMYAEGFVLTLPFSNMVVDDKKQFLKAERDVLEKHPERKFKVVRSIAHGDTVVFWLEFSLTVAGKLKTADLCCILKFNKDGKVVSDITYMHPDAVPSDIPYSKV